MQAGPSLAGAGWQMDQGSQSTPSAWWSHWAKGQALVLGGEDPSPSQDTWLGQNNTAG